MDITPLIIFLASRTVLITFVCFFSMNLLHILVRQGLAAWFLAFVAVTDLDRWLLLALLNFPDKDKMIASG